MLTSKVPAMRMGLVRGASSPSSSPRPSVTSARAGGQRVLRAAPRLRRTAGRAAARHQQQRRRRFHRVVEARGLEKEIEEALSTQTSMSEAELDDIDIMDSKGNVTSSCCGSHCDDVRLMSSPVARMLERIFNALRLTAFAEYVEERSTAFTVASAVFLFCSAAVSMYLGGPSGRALAPATALGLERVGNACLCLVYGLLGVPAFIDVAYNLATFRIDIHVLTLLAVFGTVVIGSPLEGGLLLCLFEAAHTIEGRLTMAAKGNLASLMEGTPKVAVTVKVDGDNQPLYETEETVRVEAVVPGIHVVVKAGDIVPLDGRIVYGGGYVTSENITGESLPYLKRVGDTIPAGARSVDGTLVLETLRSAEESTPMRILKLTEAAQDRKPRITQFLDNWMGLYSKAVLASTFVISLALPLFGVSVLGTGGSVYRAAAFLTAAAPCALVMAPLAYISAISAIARRGVIVRGGKVIDALSKCDAIALDKTGTLTEGELECTGITGVGENGAGDEDVEPLSFALAVSQGSTHPISLAVKKCASMRPSPPHAAQDDADLKIDDFRMIPGYGVEATAESGRGDTYKVQFGSVDFVSKHLSGSSSSEIDSLLQTSGMDKVIAVLHTEKLGNGGGGTTSLFTFSDRIRSKSQRALVDLKDAKRDLRLTMLTGDREANAVNVAKQLGIDEVYAGLLPEDKVDYVEKIRHGSSKTGFVAFVGDGINDAPALATADVGIAFADSTTAAAASAADAIVLKEGGDHISSLPYIFRVAKKTKTIMKQNIALAMVSIVGASLPSVGGYFPLWLSVSLHEGSTLLVALNSLRCLLPVAETRTERAWAVAITTAAVVLATVVLVPGIVGTKFAARLGVVGSLGGLILMLESASAGLFAGALHSLTGPDHLAALAPLSMGRSTLAAGFLGGLWGFGHSAGQLFFGAIFILLKSRMNFQLDVIENFAGAAVGLTLMAIGYFGYKEAKDFDFDRMREEGRQKGKILSKFSLATFSTGFLHGLSPDAIFPILPAVTMAARGQAIAFVFFFLLGTVGSMASYTAFIGVGSSALAQKSPDITRKISMGSSFLAVGLGITLLVSAAFGVDVFSFLPTHHG